MKLLAKTYPTWHVHGSAFRRPLTHPNLVNPLIAAAPDETIAHISS